MAENCCMINDDMNRWNKRVRVKVSVEEKKNSTALKERHLGMNCVNTPKVTNKQTNKQTTEIRDGLCHKAECTEVLKYFCLADNKNKLDTGRLVSNLKGQSLKTARGDKKKSTFGLFCCILICDY